MTKTELVEKLKADGVPETADLFEDTDEGSIKKVVNELKEAPLRVLGNILNYAKTLIEE
jgi:hypothetical protein